MPSPVTVARMTPTAPALTNVPMVCLLTQHLCRVEDGVVEVVLRDHFNQGRDKLGLVHADCFRPLAQPGHCNSAELQCGRHGKGKAPLLLWRLSGLGAGTSGTIGTTLTSLGTRRLMPACEQRTLSVPAVQPSRAAMASVFRPCWTSTGMPAITSLVRIERRPPVFFQ